MAKLFLKINIGQHNVDDFKWTPYKYLFSGYINQSSTTVIMLFQLRLSRDILLLERIFGRCRKM